MGKETKLNWPLALAVGVSVCLHLLLISRLPWRSKMDRHASTPQRLTVILLPPVTPTYLEPVAQLSKAVAPKPTHLRNRPSATQRPSPTTSPDRPSPSPSPSSESAWIAPQITPAPSPSQPANGPPHAPPLNLALPPIGATYSPPGAADTHTASSDLRQAIRSRIEAERLQKHAPTALDPDTTHIRESVSNDGTRRARIDTPWGSYCLNSPRPGAPHDARMPAQTAVPSTCP